MRMLLRLMLRPAVAAVFFCATIPALYAAGAAPVWEVLRINGDETDNTGEELPPFEIEVRDGYVYVMANRQMKVEVFTILGQLVTNRKVQPGVVRLKLDNRGIYIIKGAGNTRRINL